MSVTDEDKNEIYNTPSKMPILTRLYISAPKRLSIPWLHFELNYYLEDSEIGRPIIGYIKRELVEDIKFLYVAEVLCGSDALDDLLEHIQTSKTWCISFNKTDEQIRLELWEEGLMSYGCERETYRKKLMKKWARHEPEGEKIVWFHWTRAQEAQYQEHVRMMKRTSRAGIRCELVPEHFTEKTTAFIAEMREHGAGRNECHWTWPKQELDYYRDALKTMMVHAVVSVE